MAGGRSLSRRRRTLIRSAVALFALVAVVLAGCTGAKPDTSDEPQRRNGALDPTQLTWDPAKLAAAAPGLVGWRSPADGTPGALVSLRPDGAHSVIWEAPAADTAYVQPLEIDPFGLRMIGDVYSRGADGEPGSRPVLFGSDGSVTELALPEGYEGVADAAFVGEDVVVVVYHATRDDFETILGTVSGDGRWTTLELRGEIPDFQFVESCLACPGTDTVGIVLKVVGGAGDRDDDLLVLATLNGSALDVYTPAYLDDSLPGAQPLWGVTGVVFPRMWSTVDGVSAPVLVRAEWTGASWSETEIAPPDAARIGPEMGEVIVHDAEGGYWLRSGTSAHGAGSELLHLVPGEESPRSVGTDLSEIGWFAWVEGPQP